MAGMFAHTLDRVDTATGWTKQRVLWGDRGESGVFEQIKDIANSLPSPLPDFDSDSRFESLNDQLFRYLTQRKQTVQFIRGRAYHNDNNTPIGQKNGIDVRQWLGDHRLDLPKLVQLLTALSKTEMETVS